MRGEFDCPALQELRVLLWPIARDGHRSFVLLSMVRQSYIPGEEQIMEANFGGREGARTLPSGTLYRFIARR
jgi:hypothetical protein